MTSYGKIAGKTPQQGFTLIELSIVLVIIGLIVGGVLVGQDLIKAAAIRATISQAEKYNTAVNTFRSKYNGIPGDISKSTASTYGLFTFSAGSTGLGDGNGLIQDTGATNTPVGEIMAFWRHLSDANLIDGAFGSIGSSAIDTAAGTTSAVSNSTIGQSLPPAKIGRGLSFIVFSYSGYNYYELLPVTAIATTPAYTLGTSGLTPIEANNIDTKLDDGMPNTGVVRAAGISGGQPTATGATFATTSSAGAANSCMSGTATVSNTSNTYALVVGSGGTDPSCALTMRFN